MTAEPAAVSAAPRRRRPLLIGLLVAVALANAALLLPYARALWWLHAYSAAPTALAIPVAGVPAAALQASFGAPRTGGTHEGIDIMAPLGTAVLAAADGVIIGNRRTAIGGTVLWVLGSGRRLYYYAHMRELAPGMRMGRLVRAGDRLGAVGNSGNAQHTPPHLHFAIYAVESHFYPLRMTAIDPYPALHAAPMP
jgi:murein DD-endopeptidase MepM/ murein hydrolase activator NlpD